MATYFEDENGKWEKIGKFGKILVEPSQKYIDENTPTQEELNEQVNNQVIEEIKTTDSDLLRLIEDIAEWAELQGFEIPQSKKELIADRKDKRKNLK